MAATSSELPTPGLFRYLPEDASNVQQSSTSFHEILLCADEFANFPTITNAYLRCDRFANVFAKRWRHCVSNLPANTAYRSDKSIV